MSPRQALDEFDRARPPRLARMMALNGAGGEGLWGSDELAAILRDHLVTPLPGGDDSGDAGSVSDLLRHPDPPPGRLERLRDWAARGRHDPAVGVPPEVATLLYYSAAAAALVRRGENIGRLADDSALARGLKWGSCQPWADSECRSLLSSGLERLQSSGVAPQENAVIRILPPVAEPPASPPADEAAPCVPGYEIKARLGTGGMGTVWRAAQLSTRREVALKVVHAAFGSARERARFEREVELAAKLEHPNIARVYDSGGAAGQFHYAMELVEGLPLDRHVLDKRLSRRQVLSLMRDVCLAVQHAHQRGIIHRDLKPSNVMVTPGGVPKVLDFGLAKALGETRAEVTLTLEGQLAGTPAFMSPEQARGQVDRLDTRTDVYSLGATLYLLLTGAYPHDMAGPRYEALRRVAEEDVRRPRSVAPEIDAELEVLLFKALAAEPGQRYSSAGELGRDVCNYLSGEPLAARPASTSYLLRKRLRKHLAVVGAIAFVTLLLLTVGAVSYFREARLRRRAESNEKTAHRQTSLANEKTVLAEQRSREVLAAQRERELGIAQFVIAEGDAHMAAGEIESAKQSYGKARAIQLQLGASTFVAELGLWSACRESPPPLLEFVGHSGEVTCAAFLPDGTGIVTGSEDGTARLWDAHTGRTVLRFECVGRVQQLSISADGKRVAFAGGGRGITVWEAQTGNRVGEPGGLEGETVAVAFSPDGAHLLVGTTSDSKNVYLFDAHDLKRLRTFDGHRSAVRRLAFSSDGRYAVTASGNKPFDVTETGNDPSLQAWRVADGARQPWVQTTGVLNKLISDVAFSRDGASVMSVGYGGNVTLRHAGTGAPRWTSRLDRDATSVAFSPAGSLAAVSTAGARVEVFWADKGPTHPLAGHRRKTTFFGGARAVSFSPDGRFVLAAAGDRARVWPLFEVGALRPFVGWTEIAQPPRAGHSDTVAVSGSADGTLALSSSYVNREATLWDVPAGRPVWYQIGTKPPPGLTAEQKQEHDVLATFLPDGKGILRVDGRGRVVVQDVGQKITNTMKPWPGHVAAAVAASPDGRHALVRFWGTDELQLYDVSSGSRLFRLKLEGALVIDRMVFSPDSTLVAACSREGYVKVWDTGTGRERNSWRTSRVNTIAFSRDGKLLACAGADLQLFEIGAGTVTFNASWPFQLWALAFLPESNYLMAAGERSDLTLLDVTTHAVRNVDAGLGSVLDWTWYPPRSGLLMAQPRAPGKLHLVDLRYPAELTQLAVNVQRAGDRLAENPEDGAALLALGRWYVLRGLWDLGAACLERAARGGAEVPPTELFRAHWVTYNHSAAQSAARAARFATKENDDSMDYLRLLGETVPSVGDEARRLRDLSAFRALEHPAYFLARLHVAREDWAHAARLFEEAAGTIPDGETRVRTLLIAAEALKTPHDGGGDSRARLKMRALESAAPDSPDYRNICDAIAKEFTALARVEQRNGIDAGRVQFEEALRWSDKALSSGVITDEKERARYLLYTTRGDALWSLGRREEAIQLWKQTLAFEGEWDQDMTQFAKRQAKEKLQAIERGEEPPMLGITTPATRPTSRPASRPAPQNTAWPVAPR